MPSQSNSRQTRSLDPGCVLTPTPRGGGQIVQHHLEHDQVATDGCHTAIARPVGGEQDANPYLAQLLEDQAKLTVPQYADGPLLASIRAQIRERLADGAPTCEDVARSLTTSERTLARRLDQRGLTFGRIVEDTRRELATAMLDGPSSITEIAHALGYSDTSAFSRAFKRWTGLSPAASRKKRATVGD